MRAHLCHLPLRPPPALRLLLLLSAASCAHTGKPRALVHIGPYKTGTTHIQTLVLQLHSEQWLASHQWHWPSNFSFFSGIKEHAMIAALLNKGMDFPDFLKEAPHSSNIFLSSEGFWDLQIDAIQKLKSYLSQYEVTIVHVWRNYFDRLLSQYHEQVRRSIFYVAGTETLGKLDWNGGFHTMRSGRKVRLFPASSFLMQAIQDPEDYLLSDKSVLSRWRSVFGADAIRVLSYEELSHSRRGLMKTILSDVMAIPAEAVNAVDVDTTLRLNRDVNTPTMQAGDFRVGELRLVYETWAAVHGSPTTADNISRLGCLEFPDKDVPITCSQLSGTFFLRDNSIDLAFEHEFGRQILYHTTPTAGRRAARTHPPFCEVNVHATLADVTWQRIFKNAMARLNALPKDADCRGVPRQNSELS
eukprot:6209765-Pleurochrysis_carterae.AAC.1